jgi:hypothetical protein
MQFSKAMTENQNLPETPPTQSAEQQRQIYNWQKKLLPWLIIMPSLLVLLFMYLATQQVNQFNRAIDVKEKPILESVINTKDSSAMNKLKGNLDYIKWLTLSTLEQESLDKRYYQGGLLLLSRIFIKYLGFLTGMIIAIVGSVFIIGKLSEDSSRIDGSVGEKIRLSIISSSPGIIFGVLGTVLMVSTILQHSEITVQDSPLYLNAYGITSLRITDKGQPDTTKIDPAKAARAFPPANK